MVVALQGSETRYGVKKPSEKPLEKPVDQGWTWCSEISHHYDCFSILEGKRQGKLFRVLVLHLGDLKENLTRVNPNVNFGIWMIMMYRCRFTGYNKCTTLVWSINSGEGCVWWGTESIWEREYIGTLCPIYSPYNFCWLDGNLKLLCKIKFIN